MRESISSWWLAGFLTLLAAGGGGCGSAPATDSQVAATPAETAQDMAQQVPVQETVPEGVVNYTRIDATVACAGATPPEAMAGLKDLGFAAVINFRTAEERGATVDAGRVAAEAAGLRYHHIPFREATAEVAETFLRTVADPSNQPVYIHCGSANRVGAMWMIKRVKIDGWSVDDAIAEAETIGLRSQGLKEFAIEYVRDGV